MSRTRQTRFGWTLDQEEEEWLDRGRAFVLSRMNMPNNRREDQTRLSLPHFDQRLREADIFWGARVDLHLVMDTVRRLPIRFRTTINLRGYTLGDLVQKLLDSQGGNRAILNGLYFTGVTRDFFPRVEYGEAERVPYSGVGADRFYTPKFLEWSCDQVSIRMFPLSKVFPMNPQIPPTNDSFSAYLDEVSQTEGGSDMNCYMFWEDAFIFRMQNYPNFIQTQVKSVRTAGLGNILLHSFSCWANFEGFDYEMYIPSGNGNCFVDCILYSYTLQENTRLMLEFDANPMVAYYELTGCDVGNSDMLDAVDVDLQNLKDEYIKTIEERCKQNLEEIKCELLEEDNEENRSNTGRRKKKEKNHGFSTKKMREWATKCMHKLGYMINVWYEKEEGRLRERVTQNMSEMFVPIVKDKGRSCYGNIDIYQIGDNGKILTNSFLKLCPSTDAIHSKLVHCATVCPLFIELPIGDARRKYSRMKEFVEGYTQPFFQKMMRYHSPLGNESASMFHIAKLIQHQKSRYGGGNETGTLIFNEKRKEAIEKITKRTMMGQVPHANAITVYAFDLETVANNHTVIPPERIFENFRQSVPVDCEDMGDRIEPMFGEIPFSAQWVPVNTSDGGEFYDRKVTELCEDGREINPDSYCSNFTPYRSHLTNQEIKGYPDLEYAGDFILDDPVTEYGGNMLGKCVDDMLLHIAQHAYANELSKEVYIFAHNAAKFDLYVMLLYNYRWPVKRMLLTSKGILSATITVTIHDPHYICYERESPDDDGGVEVNIHIRDTRLQVSGSLHALCVGFGVPAAWRKLDFPIRMVTWENCYDPDIKAICKAYGENDVKCLAYIIHKINRLIGDSFWNPASVFTKRPPICQFVTNMAMVRQSTLNHFKEVAQSQAYLVNYPPWKNFQPRAIDVPALRVFLEGATMGGRVVCMAKSYSSPYFGVILKAYLADERSTLQSLHQTLLTEKKCCQVLDVTSLYPTAQAYCPMPLGDVFSITPDICLAHIDQMDCDLCEAMCHLCPLHKYSAKSDSRDLRPFSIILVKNVTVSHDAKENMYNLCGRKIYSISSGEAVGLEYTLESTKEMNERLAPKHQAIPEVQAYTNVDLYWMRKGGFCFEIIGGFTFGVGMTYNSFIEPAFQKRIEAKQAKNKLLSDFLKLMYNGSFGVTAQNDITESGVVTNLPDDLKDCSPLDQRVISHLVKNKCLDGSEEVTGECFTLPNGQAYIKKRKVKRIAEFYADQSPLQIGCAILAYARHIMNLFMMNNYQTMQNYTDTDSDCVSERLAARLDDLGMINNDDTAPMGSLKNDHAERNGTSPRVVWGIFGAKKVKMYVTLNAEGDLKIYNTFKGFQPATFVDGKKMSEGYADMIVSRALVHIGMEGFCPDQLVTAWKRSLSVGVSINDHWQRMETETYLGHSMGTKVIRSEFGITEFFVPPGSNVTPDFYIFRSGEKDADRYRFSAARLDCLPGIWSVDSLDTIYQFLDKYYAHADREYTSSDPEYMKIMAIFQDVNLRNSLSPEIESSSSSSSLLSSSSGKLSDSFE
jgi:hypothetical protein